MDATIVDDNFSMSHLIAETGSQGVVAQVDTARLSVLSSLPQVVLDSLAEGIFIRRIESGDIVLREGDIGDSCFIVAKGAVRVLKRDPMDSEADLIDVARLAEGELFGEFALLGDRRRHATVQALKTTELYEIPRRLIMTLSSRHPGVIPTLQRLYRDRLLETLMKTAPFFSSLQGDRRSELMERFTPVRAVSGECIIPRGRARRRILSHRLRRRGGDATAVRQQASALLRRSSRGHTSARFPSCVATWLRRR